MILDEKMEVSSKSVDVFDKILVNIVCMTAKNFFLHRVHD